MAYNLAVADALAQEVRLRESQKRFAAAQASVAALDGVNRTVVTALATAKATLADAQAALTQASVDGAGVTEDFGEYSALDQALRLERFAGKSAAIDHVKANPACTEEAVIVAYSEAALAVRDQPFLLQNPDALLRQYAANAASQHFIPDASWPSFRALLLNAPKATLMGM